MEITILIGFIAIAIGLFGGWLLFGYGQHKISDDELSKSFVRMEVFKMLEEQIDVEKADNSEKDTEIKKLGNNLAALSKENQFLKDKLEDNGKELEISNQKMQFEFEKLANRLFEEKSQKFTAQNQLNIANLLNPLKEKIQDFEKNIHQKYMDETKGRISLKKEIEQLYTLNNQLSKDAHNLALALKGDSKTQGDWGEMQLEMLLVKAGLSKDIHFRVQPSFKDDFGQDKRPDIIINLPDNKHIIIDSKVSLTAFERFYNSDDKQDKQQSLLEHLVSIKRHIKDLGAKQYQNLYEINSPDYILMFIPLESALNLALKEDTNIFLNALERNVVLVSNTTLLATLRTISYIWKQEKQKNNVLEIAKQSGLLYDKFVGFTEDLKNVGQKIGDAQLAYESAMGKLKDSKKYGDTLIGRAEKIKALGAKASKNISEELKREAIGG